MSYDTGYCEKNTDFYTNLLKNDYKIVFEGETRAPSTNSVIIWSNPETGDWLTMELVHDLGCVISYGALGKTAQQ
jgi:exonuclease V gamma subunit